MMSNCLERLSLAFWFLVEGIEERLHVATRNWLIVLDIYVNTKKASTMSIQKQIQWWLKVVAVFV